MLITWLLLRGARESATRQQHHGRDQAARARRCSSSSALTHINTGELHAVRAERLHRHPPGRGDRVLRLHRLRRDLDGRGGDEEPAAQPADRHPRRAGDLHGHLRDRRRRADRAWCRTQELAKSADPLAYALQAAGLPARRLDRRARRGGLDGGGAAGVPVRPAAHLLRDGARRPAAAVGGEGAPEDARFRTPRRCSPASFVALCVARSAMRPRPTTSPTSARCSRSRWSRIGVVVLRVTEPDRPRPFRVPFVWPVAILGAAACVFVMEGLPRQAWERFGIWLVIGLVAVLLLRLLAFADQGASSGGRSLRSRGHQTRFTHTSRRRGRPTRSSVPR